jgi:predicted nucleotidyltransferase
MWERVRAVVTDQPLPGVAAVYLFGSHAAGRAHRESDVDIAFLLDRRAYPTSASRSAARLEILARIGDRLGAPADVVILNDAPPLLGRAVITDGQLVVAQDESLDHAYRRDIQLRAADLEPFIARHRRGLLAGLRQ